MDDDGFRWTPARGETIRDYAITGIVGLIAIGTAAAYTGIIPGLGGTNVKAKVAKANSVEAELSKPNVAKAEVVASEESQRSVAILKSIRSFDAGDDTTSLSCEKKEAKAAYLLAKDYGYSCPRYVYCSKTIVGDKSGPGIDISCEYKVSDVWELKVRKKDGVLMLWTVDKYNTVGERHVISK